MINKAISRRKSTFKNYSKELNNLYTDIIVNIEKHLPNLSNIVELSNYHDE
jgi:hypothetical protein